MIDKLHENNAKLFTEKMMSKVKIVVSETQSSLSFNHNLENYDESNYQHSNIISVTNIIIDKANSVNNSYQYKNTNSIVRYSISGYGDVGPEGCLPGYDFLLQAESGEILLSLIWEAH